MPDLGAAPAFDLLNTATLAPALERLQQFWLERRQEDGIAGDLGAGVPDGINVPPAMDDEGYYPSMGDGRGCNLEDGLATEANTPLATPGVETTTSGAQEWPKKLRGEVRAAKAEEKRLGKGKSGMEEGPAWWLDVMCPSVADMRELRKVS